MNKKSKSEGSLTVGALKPFFKLSAKLKKKAAVINKESGLPARKLNDKFCGFKISSQITPQSAR
jgi:hypothetical protein